MPLWFLLSGYWCCAAELWPPRVHGGTPCVNQAGLWLTSLFLSAGIKPLCLACYSTKGGSGVVSHLVSTGQTHCLPAARASLYLHISASIFPSLASSEAYKKALPRALGSWADSCALAVSYGLHMSLLNSMCGFGGVPSSRP